MMVRVIYKDQTAGVIESHLLDTMISKGRIVAYHSADRWVPVDLKKIQSDEKIDTILCDRENFTKHYTH